MSRKFAASAFFLCVLASGLLPRALLAATPSASVGVSATVQAGCLISATPIPLPDHLVTSPMTKSGVLVTCTIATPYVVDLGPGERPAAAVRKLTNTASALRVPASAGYPSAIKVDRWINVVPFTAHLECCRTLPVQPVAPGATTHAITVVVTY